MGFGYGSAARKVFGPLMYPAARRFGQLAAEADRDLQTNTIAATAGKYLPRYVEQVTICGAENIPLSGPLIIASNHPGTIDALLIFSALPRDDLKLIISRVPVVESLPGARQYLIYNPADSHQRIAVVRGAIQHLQKGGMLMIFPTGKLDPDPSVMPGAREALKGWSGSLGIFLRRVPHTKVVPTIVSGVISLRALRNPLTKLRRELWMQQRIAAYIQVVGMLTSGRKSVLSPKVTFGRPISPGESGLREDSERLMSMITNQAEAVLAEHTAQPGCTAGDGD